MPKKLYTGRDAFLQLLIDEGVTHLFGNPGTTELAIMEAVPQFPKLKYVLGLQESAVLSMADGFARASNKLAAVNLHCTPGLGHAMGALYSAKFSGSPLIITAGQYELGYGLQEPLLYEPLVPLAQPCWMTSLALRPWREGMVKRNSPSAWPPLTCAHSFSPPLRARLCWERTSQSTGEPLPCALTISAMMSASRSATYTSRVPGSCGGCQGSCRLK